MSSIIFMFSGQGSHYYQMGRELFAVDKTFQYWMNKADIICQELIGLSIIKELYHDNHKKGDPFLRTLFTHPAIFMVEYALAQALVANGIMPQKVLGASLGEIVAAAFTEVLSFENALQTVIYQAQFIERNCQLGNMIAILHNSTLYNQPIIKLNSELAAIHFPSHFVVSGKCTDIDKIQNYLINQKITCQTLAVSHAFHSSELETASFNFLNFINRQTFNQPCLPYISCEKTYTLNAIAPQHFWDAIRKPIQFQNTIQSLEYENHNTYLDVGPAGSLATFVKYNLASTQSKTFSTLSPFKANTLDFTSLRESLNL